MAGNIGEFPDTGQSFSGFKKASEILRMQNQPKCTTDSTNKPISSLLGSAPLSQPGKWTSTTTGSDFYSNFPCQEWFEAKDNDIYFERQSQILHKSLPDFTQSSNVMVNNNNNNNKGDFIKASALLTSVISQYEVNKQQQQKSPSKSERFFKDLNPSANTENLLHFDDSTRQQQPVCSNSDFYPYPRTTGHNVLRNPFLFTAMRNPAPPMPLLPKRTKKSDVPFKNKGDGPGPVTYKKNKASPYTNVPLSKRKIYQIKNQGSITSFIKFSAREKNSKSNDDKVEHGQTSTPSFNRSGGKVCKKKNNNVGCSISSIPSYKSRVLLESVSGNSSDTDSEGKHKQPTNFTQEISSSSDEENPEDYNLSMVHYGLFGCDPPDATTGEDYFLKLPDELKGIIFCQLPSYHLFEVCPKVCRDWRRIIQNEKFMVWKFRHYCYKKNKTEDYWIPTFGNFPTFLSSISCLVRQYSLSGIVACNSEMGYTSPCIYHHMKTQSKSFTDLLPSLKRHKYYEEAMHILRSSFPDCFADNVPSPWSLIALLCIISDTVKSIEQLLQILASASSKSSFDVLLDKVYEILHMYICRKYHYKYLQGIIYRLSCALHSFENSGTVTVADLNQSIEPHHQQSIVKYCESSKKIRFSPEQLQIINHTAKPGDIIKIIAFAGTGKTSTLVRYTKMRPGLKFLLVVFNKSVAEHAKTVFPKNVHCTTGHGLAFRKTGFIYAKNGKLHLRNLKVCDLQSALPCNNEHNSVRHCQVVLTVLEKFFASKDKELQEHHVTAALETLESKTVSSSEFDNQHWLEDAKKFWHQMIDLSNKNVKMTHDGYLKLYQIKSPQLTNYDVILIDEAQDLTPAIADILISQKQAKILVGDPYQQIYSFRGAINLISDIEGTHTFYLTQSFRFGHEIASVANFILNYYSRSKMILVGSSTKESTIDGKDIGQVAYISRSNSVLFKMAAFVCCVQKPKAKVFFIGGLASWEFDLLRRLCIFRDEGYFSHSSSSRDIFLSKFPSYWALSRYVKESMDGELLPKVQILEQYTSNLHKVLSYIEASEVKDIKDADVVFTTAHKAKGLEFSTVKILDDFNIETHEERNLLYVAVTRAKNSLFLDEKIISYLEKSGELRLKVRCYNSLDGEELRCSCNNSHEEDHDEILLPVVVEKKRIRLVSGTEIGGFICKRCLIREHRSLSFLYQKPDPV